MGSVVLSVDAELGWGFHDLPDPPNHRLTAGREGWTRLASLLEDFDVPATWAVVGHLLLESCDGRHDDHPLGPVWFERERTDWAGRPEFRFGVDLVRELLASPVDHDIGCHTYSHVLADDPAVTPMVFQAELEACAAVFDRFGLDPVSFVYPRNRIAHRSLLAEFGYTTYRGSGGDLSPTRRRLSKWRHLVGGGAPLVQPVIDQHGLVEIPPSLFLFGFNGLAETLTRPLVGDPVVTHSIRGIDRAVDSDGVLHLWLHPNNLADERAVDRVRDILAHLEMRRSTTDLRVETMHDIAERLRDERREPPDTPTPVSLA